MTMYKDMKFPEWEFQEFPLAVAMLNGRPSKDPYDPKRPGKSLPVIIVKDEDELERLLQGGRVIPDEKRLEDENDVRETLYLEAEQIGAKIDKRWSVSKIKIAIAEHKSEAVL